MSNFTVQDLLFRTPNKFRYFYNQIDFKKFGVKNAATVETFWKVYNKLIEAAILIGNVPNVMEMLRAYVTEDRNAPNMIHAIYFCIKHAPLSCARKMYDEMIAKAHWHCNYDERLNIRLRRLLKQDKRGILNPEREELKRRNISVASCIVRVSWFTGIFKNKEFDYPIINYNNNEFYKNLVDYCEDLKIIKKREKILSAHRKFAVSKLKKELFFLFPPEEGSSITNFMKNPLCDTNLFDPIFEFAISVEE